MVDCYSRPCFNTHRFPSHKDLTSVVTNSVKRIDSLETGYRGKVFFVYFVLFTGRNKGYLNLWGVSRSYGVSVHCGQGQGAGDASFA